MSIIRDAALAEAGRMKIAWVEDYMPALRAIRSRFEQEKPFAGKKITMSIHMEAKTAYLALCLKAGGAEVHATAATRSPHRTMWRRVWTVWACRSTAGMAPRRRNTSPI